MHDLLTTLRHRADTLLSERSFYLRLEEEERQTLRKAEAHAADCAAAHAAVVEVAEASQRAAHEGVAAVVTRCLSAVFGGEAPEFRIVFERKHGQTEARLCFVRDGAEVDPCESAAGGVLDVAAFALRLACLTLSRPPLRKLLVLDEPFRMLSKKYRPVVAELVKKLAEETGTQVIMVTHDPEFRIGEVVSL